MNDINERKFFAFISYSHRDKKAAKYLYRKLNEYRLPVKLLDEYKAMSLPRRLSPIFIDDEEMAKASVQEGMRSGLARSRFLIVVCSPNSAKSSYVNSEVTHFIEEGRGDSIIPYIIRGVPCSGDPQTECYPPAMRDPDRLGADVQALKGDAVLRVIATMLGVDMGVLAQRDKQRRLRRIALTTIVLVALALGFGFYNYGMRLRIADEHRKMLSSEATRLVASAEAETEGMELPILLAREACSYLPRESVEDTEAIAAYRNAVLSRKVMADREYLFPVSEFSFASSNIELGRSYDNGRLLACSVSDRTYLFDIATGAQRFCCEGDEVYFSPDGTWCISTDRIDGENTDVGMLIPSGDVLFTHTAPPMGGWATPADEVVFEDDSSAAYILPSAEAIEGSILRVTKAGGVTTLDGIPEKVAAEIADLPEYFSIASRYLYTRHYETLNRTPRAALANENAAYTVDDAMADDALTEDPVWDALVDRGYDVRDSQRFEGINLTLYQCFQESADQYYTFLYTAAGQQCYGRVQGRAFFDEDSGCLYALDRGKITNYRINRANGGMQAWGDALRFSTVSRDGNRYFSLYLTGDLYEWANGGEIALRVLVQELSNQDVLADISLYHDATNDEKYMCYVDGYLEKLLYLDPQGAFHLVDLSQQLDLLTWKAEDPSMVNAMCFDKQAGLIVITTMDGKDERYGIEMRSMGDGSLLGSYDITEQMDLRYKGLGGVQAVRLLNGKLLVGTYGQSVLFDVEGDTLLPDSAHVFDYSYGHCSDPTARLMTSDGLLFFTNSDLGTVDMLSGIYDIGRGVMIEDIPFSERYAYDEERGMLLCQPVNSSSKLSERVQVFSRRADGGFEKVCDIASDRLNMALPGGNNALDGSYMLLENEDYTEVYRLNDGKLALRLKGTGLVLKNEALHDVRQNNNFGAQYPFLLDYDQVEALAREMLTTATGQRQLTDAEKDKFYIARDLTVK